jgi:hypothetical protein
MLESTVGLLGGLCLSALTLLISFCIFGSIVAALRAVNQGSAAAIAGRSRSSSVSLTKRLPWDNDNRDMTTASKMFGGNAAWLKESAGTGESCAKLR